MRRPVTALLLVVVLACLAGLGAGQTFSSFSATTSNSGNSFSSASVFPPVNSVLPAITGFLQQGQTLTVTAGTWSHSPTLSYQWQRCDSSGNSCTDIGGSTGTTYVPGVSDLNDTIRVRETATNSGGSASATSSATTSILSGAPVNSVVPTISGLIGGLPLVGATLSKATDGTWSSVPASTNVYTYQWQDCDASGNNCVAIGSGGTSSSYLLASTDLNKTIRLLVTATNAYGNASATSAASPVTQNPAVPSNSVAPSVSGLLEQGQTLTASSGTWSSSVPILSYGYQWQRCGILGTGCSNISSATSSTYTPVLADVGSTLVLLVSATNAGGTSSAVPSSATSIIALNGAPASTALPTITGTAAVGQTLNASTGAWSNSPTAYSYQWQDCNASGLSCTNILTGLTSSYVVAAGDSGHTLRVIVTATNVTGSTQAISAATSTV